MDRGKKYKFPASYYPRYKVFQQRLSDFMPRFERIIDAGGLKECVSNGVKRLKELSTHYQGFDDSVTVYLFADDSYLRTQGKRELVIEDRNTVMEDREKETSTRWSNFLRETSCQTLYQCHVAVCVVSSTEHFREAVNSMSSLTGNQKSNVIIHSQTDNQSFMYNDVATASSLPTPSGSSTELLNRMIQFLFETKVVAFVEKVLGFMGNFIPKGGQPLERSLVSAVDDGLQTSIRDVNVIQDMAPDCGMQQLPDGRLVNPSELNEKQKTDIFHHKMIDFVEKKTKCILIEQMSKKFGLQPSLINEFMNDGYYGVEKKVNTMCKSLNIGDWPSEEGVHGAIFVCKMFGYDVVRGVSNIINGAEDYVERKMKILNLLSKLEFELHGLLKISAVPYDTVIPEIPKLSIELHNKLIEIPGIDSCGHKYGKLVFHTTNTLTYVELNEIDRQLRKFNYPFGYTTQKITVKSQAAGGAIEQGHQIRARKLRPDRDSQNVHGTLGCFVKITKLGSANNSASGQSGDGDATPEKRIYEPVSDQEQYDDTLHGITCAHCLDKCHKLIEVKRGDSFKNFGQAKEMLYHPEFLDIAAVEVYKDKVRECNLELKRSSQIELAETWEVFQEEPKAGMLVHKDGGSSGFTKGIITSADELTSKNKALADRFAASGVEGVRLHPFYSILIEPPADIPKGISVLQGIETLSSPKPFSEEGDSGSAICIDDPNRTRNVYVVALLCGSLSEKLSNDDLRYICTHGSNLKRLFEAFQKEHNCTIIPAIPAQFGAGNRQSGAASGGPGFRFGVQPVATGSTQV